MKKTTLLIVAAASAAALASDILTVSSDTVIDEDRTVAGIVFTTGATLSGTGKITIDSGTGITVEAGTATIENDVIFSAGANEVVCTVGDTGVLVQTGVWSGSSPLKLVGQGYKVSTHRFELRGANTFTGDLGLIAALVHSYNGKAFGTADGRTRWTLEGVNGSKIVLHGGEYDEYFQATNKISKWSGWWQSFHVAANTTNIINGTFDLNDPHYMVIGANSHTVFAGTVVGRNTYGPSLDTGSVVVLTNSAALSTVQFAPSGSGTYYFYGTRSGSYAGVSEYAPKCRVVCMAANRFNCSSTIGGYVGDNGVIDLNGFDQNGGRLGAGNANGTFTSSTPATWHVDMGTGAFTNKNVFAGAVNLEKKGSGLLGLSSVSSSTGTLTIAAGNMEFVGGGFWAGDININAGNLLFGPLMNLESSQTLSIASGSKVVLNGGNLNAQNVYYDGNKLAVGEYSKANGDEFVDGAYVLNVLAAPIVAETATWTGEGSDDLIETAANWGADREAPPDFLAGLTTAVFADSGSRAVVSDDTALAGIGFKPSGANASFKIAKGSAAAAVLLGSGGVTIDDSTETWGEYVIEPPLNANSAFRVAGKGKLELKNGGTFAGKVIVSNTNIRATGEFSALNGLSFIRTGGEDSRAELHMSNAVMNVGTTSANGLYLAGVDKYYPLRALAGTTNRVVGRCQIDGVSRPIFFKDSETTFAGPCSWGSYLVPIAYDGARIIFEGALTAYDFNTSAGAGGGEFTYVFRATGNKISDGGNPARWGCRMQINTHACVRTEVENAFNYNFEKLHMKGGTLDLAGCSQQFGPLAGNGWIKSDSNAVLRVNQVVHTIEVPSITNATTNTVVFAGGAGLYKTGALAMYLGGVSSTTGTLEVAEGVLGFADGGAWTNCSMVAASGSGQLVISAARSFNRYSDVCVTSGGGAKVDIAAGVVHTCCYVYLDGTRQRVGDFSAATHPTWFSGGGVLRSLGLNTGTAILFR